MPGVKTNIRHKHFRLDFRKIQRAQKLLGTRTETETIERALEQVIAERERDRRVRAALERFASSGVRILDVYGKLEA
ncbi:MAG: hypothetical protein FJW34_26705 [Acidobacteria bacterium]|nr:hypothetical protein [Acidobacteriota bacterium]